jgi:hypothetical protein
MITEEKYAHRRFSFRDHAQRRGDEGLDGPVADNSKKSVGFCS